MAVKPVLQALVLAEKVWTLDDGRKAICGTFTKVVIQKRVAQPEVDSDGNTIVPSGGAGAPWAYLSLTGVAGETVLQLRFVNLRHNRPVFHTQVELECEDRLATVEFALPLPYLAVDEPGDYAFDLVCDDEILGTWRVEVEVDDSTAADDDENDHNSGDESHE